MAPPSMTILQVPYREQFLPEACGAAAFEMVFRHFRSSSFSQRKFYNKYAQPHGSGNYRITSKDIVAEATNTNFNADWGRMNPDPAEMARQIGHFVCTEHIPIIACQKYTDQEPHLGHFRVIIGIDGDQVTLHDPCKRTGGKGVQWPISKLRDYWKPTGENVTGGVTIWIADDAVQNPLAPNLSNIWAELS